MQNSNILSIFLPVALGIIMLGLGLSLTLADFKRVLQQPKAALVGLTCQMIVMPLICYFVAKFMQLPPALAVGLMLLAASPGGATANLYSHLAKGDVALNISLTAVNSILSLFTLPLIVNFSLDAFMGINQVIPLQFSKIVEVFAIVLIPVIMGMLIRNYSLDFANKMEKPVKIASAILLIVVIIGAISKEKEHIVNHFQQVGLAALVFNVLSMVAGYFIPQMLGINRKQAIAIGMEIGIHNGTLAIYIALSVLNQSMMSIPPAVYSLIMFFTAALFGYIVSRKAE